jgi:hypothetical protein
VDEDAAARAEIGDVDLLEMRVVIVAVSRPKSPLVGIATAIRTSRRAGAVSNADRHGWLRLPAAPHAPLTRRRSATNPTCRGPSAGSSRAPPEVRYQRAMRDQRGRVLPGVTPAARQLTGGPSFGLLLEPVEQLDCLDVRYVLPRPAPPFEFDQRRAREHRDGDIAELVALALGDEPLPLGQAG